MLYTKKTYLNFLLAFLRNFCLVTIDLYNIIVAGVPQDIVDIIATLNTLAEIDPIDFLGIFNEIRNEEVVDALKKLSSPEQQVHVKGTNK